MSYVGESREEGNRSPKPAAAGSSPAAHAFRLEWNEAAGEMQLIDLEPERRARAIAELAQRILEKWAQRYGAAGVHREPWSNLIIIPVPGAGEYLPVKVSDDVPRNPRGARQVYDSIVQQLTKYSDDGKL